MKKLITFSYVIAIIALIIGSIGLFTPATSFIRQIGADGDSNFTNLVASGDITVGDDLTVTGDVAVSGEIQAQRMVQGGTVTNATSSMNTAFSLTAAQVCDSSVITVNTAATASFVAAASLDITLPATSTLFADCLDTAGDSVSFIFVNASPTAASTTQMIAGTGCDDYTVPSAGDDAIPGLGIAKITLTRATDVFGVNHTVDCTATIEEFND